MLTDHGTLTVGGCVPLALQAEAIIGSMIACGQKVGAEFQATLTLSLGQLQAKLEAALKLQLSLTVSPPTIAGQIDAALKLIAALQAQLALGLPVVSLQLAAVAKLILDIEADILKLNASLVVVADCGIVVAVAIAFATGFGAALATPGVRAYAFKGTAQSLPSELGSAIGANAEQWIAWVFAVEDGSAAEVSGRAMFVGAPT